MVKCSVVGGSGYAGGELLRLITDHPELELQQVTSESNEGIMLSVLHPNLRKQTSLKFSSIKNLEKCDVLFLALPHGVSRDYFEKLSKYADIYIDLSQDFRLDPQFVYALAELNRDKLKTANFIAGAGCNATASILSLWPWYKNNLIETDKTVVEAKISSSAAGNKASLATHHAERTGVVRTYKATGHRHIKEICHFLKTDSLHFSATAIEMVRGILVTAHLFTKEKMTDKDIWKLYRQEYKEEPFIRIVKEKKGVYRYPEPKLVKGTNYCDIGFEIDKNSNRVVVMAAIDNLVKGTAGQVIQALNIRLGFSENFGLSFTGLHPV